MSDQPWQVALSILAFVGGFTLALHLVGYGVRGGLAQIIRLWTYRRGWCQCGFCKPNLPPTRHE